MLDMHGESFIWSKPKVRGESLPPLSDHVAIPFVKKVSSKNKSERKRGF
jgi:hypothetical protein